MSIFKTITIAALTVGIAGSASAAENKFVSPLFVKAIVSGEILEHYRSIPEGQSPVLKSYLMGFGIALNNECRILPASGKATLQRYLDKVTQDGNYTGSLEAGYDDGILLAQEYGCGSDVGKAASQTMLRFIK